MTLNQTLMLLNAIMTDLPQAITTGADLIRLINDAYARLTLKGVHTKADIDALLSEIKQRSQQIQRL